MLQIRDDSAHHILLRIRQLTRGIDQHSRVLVRDWGVTVPQLLCLKVVAEAGSVTVGSVVRAVHLNGSTVTGILDRLEKRGYVQRQRDPKDRRVVTLTVTPEGEEFLRHAPAPLQETFVSRLAELPEGELRDLMAALDRLVKILGVEEVEARPILDSSTEVS